MNKIAFFGEPLVEFSQHHHTDKTGGNVFFQQGFGGDVSNFAISAARQGGNIISLSPVGKDHWGEEFIALWEKEGIDTQYIKNIELKGHTGLYFISYNDDGHHFTYMRKGSAASQTKLSDIPLSILKELDVFHFSAISQAISTSACDTCFSIIEILKNTDTIVSYDTNLRLSLWPIQRARSVIKETLPFTGFCFSSYDEATELTGKSNFNDIINTLHSWGAKNVILKLGGKGAIFSSEYVDYHAAGHHVNLVDATGAGDVFAGAFIVEYLRTKDAVDALNYANAAAALSVTGYGAINPIPKKSKVVDFIKNI
ncbi:TPA: sugar kinase [Escherichia coli]|nr:sugar kinase [Escherichia coli]EFL2148279.1 sugar kinase [Escherichia coli]EGA3983899.1 sugar kinase [Escherichia coli]HBA8915345.1 sugar kinase [Escherichia coli]HBA9837434.1 sugar kinase [Escherichia coli]